MLFDRRQNNLFVLVAVGALAVQIGHTAIQLFKNHRSDGFILIRNNNRHLGIIKAVDYHVNYLANQEYHQSGV